MFKIRRVRNILKNNEAGPCLIVGIVMMLLMFAFMFFVVLMIDKIAFAVVIMGVGILAIGGGVFLLRRGLDKVKLFGK